MRGFSASELVMFGARSFFVGVEGGHPVHCGILSPQIRLPITCLPVVKIKNVPWAGAELAPIGPPWVRGVSDSPGDTVFYNHWSTEVLGCCIYLKT